MAEEKFEFEPGEIKCEKCNHWLEEKDIVWIDIEDDGMDVNVGFDCPECDETTQVYENYSKE